MTQNTTAAPAANAPATIHLYSDTDAAVVTRVAPNGKSVWIRPVEIDEDTRVNDFPITTVQGDISRPRGEEERYTLRKDGRYVRAGEGIRDGAWLTFGQSVRRQNLAY